MHPIYIHTGEQLTCFQSVAEIDKNLRLTTYQPLGPIVAARSFPRFASKSSSWTASSSSFFSFMLDIVANSNILFTNTSKNE